MPVMNMFPGGSTLQIPLDAPTAFSASAGNAKVELTWTDPKDKYATPEGDISDTGDQLVSEWDHTVLVRKTGSQPAGPNDGTVVVSSSVRNQYQSTPYTDTGLTNDTTYYYAVFAYNKDGVASEGAFASATPIAGTPLSQLAEGTLIKILENGSPVEFYLAKHSYEPDLNGAGRELLVRKGSYSSGAYGPLGTTDYIGKTLDTWCNTTYPAVLSQAVQELMGETTITSVSKYGTTSTIPRKAFALSMTELGLGNYLYAQTEGSVLPIAGTLRALGESQWTRTISDYSGTNNACYVNASGSAAHQLTNQGHGYRPAFTLPDSSRVDAGLNLIEE